MAGVSLTRRKLYELLWSNPATKVAAQFGISDVGLKKICERHRIPTPGRGYWAKLAAGQTPKKVLLYSVDDARLENIDINPPKNLLPLPAQAAIKAIEHTRRLTPKSPVARDESPPELGDLHPAILKSALELRRAKDDPATAYGDGLCGIRVARASVERAIFVIDGLAKELDARGLKLEPNGNAMRLTAGADQATFGLSERSRTLPHVPSASEIAEEQRRVTQRERHWRNPDRWRLPPYGRSYPDKDVTWTGELVFEIVGYGEGVRRRWADGRRQNIEELITSIADGLEVFLAVQKGRREEREAQHRRWEEAEARRKRAIARAERERARIQLLGELIRRFDEVQTVRQWLRTHLSPGPSHSNLARLLAWTEARLCGLEEKLSRTRWPG